MQLKPATPMLLSTEEDDQHFLTLLPRINEIEKIYRSIKYPKYNVDNYGNNEVLRASNSIKTVKIAGCNQEIRVFLENDANEEDIMITTIDKNKIEYYLSILKTYDINLTLEEIIEEFNTLGFNIEIVDGKFHQKIGEIKKRAYYGFCMLRHFYYYMEVTIGYFMVLKEFPNLSLVNKYRVLSYTNKKSAYSFIMGGYWNEPIDMNDCNSSWNSYVYNKWEKSLTKEDIEEFLRCFNPEMGKEGLILGNTEYLRFNKLRSTETIDTSLISLLVKSVITDCIILHHDRIEGHFTKERKKVYYNIPICNDEDKMFSTYRKIFDDGSRSNIIHGRKEDPYCLYVKVNSELYPLKISRWNRNDIKTYINLAITQDHGTKLISKVESL